MANNADIPYSPEIDFPTPKCYYASMKLRAKQRDLIAEKLMDSANLALGALVFSQMVSGNIQYVLLVLGLFLYFTGWFSAIRLKKGGR